MFQKIRLGSAIAALALFCFPWLDIQCSEKSLATQSGVQAIYGSASASDLMKKESKGSPTQPTSEKDESLGFAPLVGLAFLAVIAAVIFSLIAVFRGGAQASFWASALPAIAFAFLLVQLAVGFPVQHKMQDAMVDSRPSTTSGEPSIGEQMGASIGCLDGE